jgi:hypothetical protein
VRSPGSKGFAPSPKTLQARLSGATGVVLATPEHATETQARSVAATLLACVPGHIRPGTPLEARMREKAAGAPPVPTR